VTQQLLLFRRFATLLGLPGLVGSCNTLAPHEPALPVGAVSLATPAVFQEWYLRTQSCSGLSADFSTVQFYVVPGVNTFPTEAGPKVGLWEREGHTNRIVIAGNYLGHEMVVRHEMLHALLQREGHPSDYFVDRCHLTWESWNSGQAD
jgi:hypothetical protein